MNIGTYVLVHSQRLTWGLVFFLNEKSISRHKNGTRPESGCSGVGENCSTILCGIYIEEAPIVSTIPPVVETGELQRKMLAVFQNKRVWRKEEHRRGHVFHLNSEEIIKAHGEKAMSLITIVNKILQCQTLDEASGKTVLAAGFHLRGI